jgi:hypothetical protein
MASRNRERTVAVAIALALTLASCGSDTSSSSTTSTSLVPTTTAPSNPVFCEEVTGLFAAGSASDPLDGWCGEWVDLARGRAIKGSTGSASLWTRRTEHGTALVIGAVHTLGQGWFGAEGTAVEARLVDPGAEAGVLRLFLVHPDGSGPDALASPWFRVYNTEIAAERNGNLMRDVLPREDFYVAATDSQKLDPTALPLPMPAPILPGTVPLYDPLSTTLADPTFAAADPGAMVLLLGFPNESGVLTAGVGRVLTDAEAEQAIGDLAALGDPEGEIAYESEIEVIIEGAAAPGMSGGPVVDAEGRLVAVMVRASDEQEGLQYVRAVRMTHIASELAEAFDALPPAQQDAIRSYLEN